MLPLFDMMMQAQNGTSMETMARQFGLAQEQVIKAMQALMPAFATGLQKNATNPYDLGAFLTALSGGQHAKYFEDLGQAFTPQGVADGNGILGHLFGSKEVSRAVAAQAAQMTGISQEIYKQMLPVIASTIMGGLFRQMTGQDKPASNHPLAGNPMADAMQQWMEATGMVKKPEAAPNPFDNPFTQAMQGFLRPEKAGEARTAGNIFTDNPFARAFQEMMAESVTKAAAAKAPEPEQAASPLADMVGTMFDSGIEVQKNYQKNLEAIFERYAKSR